MYKYVSAVGTPEINEWLFPKLTVILIGGKAGVGKSTACNIMGDYLLDNNISSYFCLAHFALGVKKVADLMAWDRKKDRKGRKLLQQIGNVGREYDKNTWVKYLMNYLDEKYLDVLIVDDWRFPNEAEYFLNNPELYNTFTIYINSPEREMLKGTEEWNDVSETSLDNFCDFDYIIENHKDMDGYAEDVEKVLFDIISESKKGGKS